VLEVGKSPSFRPTHHRRQPFVWPRHLRCSTLLACLVSSSALLIVLFELVTLCSTSIAFHKNQTMRATDRTVIASMLLLLTNDLCSSFVIGPSSSTRGLNTFHQPPRIIRDDTNDVQRRNHVFAYYPKGEESSSSLKSQEGQQQSLQS
jgi:hypothetical protein